MKLVFYNRRGKQQSLGIFETQADAEQMIRDYLTEHSYEPTSWRITAFEDKWLYDVGLQTEYFVLYKNNDARSVGIQNEVKRSKRRRLPTV